MSNREVLGYLGPNGADKTLLLRQHRIGDGASTSSASLIDNDIPLGGMMVHTPKG